MRANLAVTAIAGWLFSDLLLALSIVVLGTQDPQPRSAVAPARPARLALERRYVEVKLTVDPDAARRGDRSAIEAIRRAVDGEGGRLRGRRAGIVLTFGAEHSGGEHLAHNVNKLLSRADSTLFADVATRDFELLGASGGAVMLNIYPFYND